LDLSRNVLCDIFAESLADCLRINRILTVIKITDNNITSKGSAMLLKAINEENDTIISFGDLNSEISLGIKYI